MLLFLLYYLYCFSLGNGTVRVGLFFIYYTTYLDIVNSLTA